MSDDKPKAVELSEAIPGDAEDYLWDGSGEPDALVAELEGLLKPLRYDRNLPSPEAVEAAEAVEGARVVPLRAWRNSWWLAAAALVLLALGWTLVRTPDPIALRPELAPRSGALVEQLASSAPAPSEGWRVEVTGGVPSCDGQPLLTGARLQIGAWMQTDDGASARLTVPKIGVIEVMAGSRLRILASHAAQHRVELARGSIHTSVKAAARIFIVETPLATVVDLGCSYGVTLDDNKLAVEVWSGAVALEPPRNSARREQAFVPAGASCRADSRAIGTPYHSGASRELIDALTRHDLGEPDALDAALKAARGIDELSLWHLYDRAAEAERKRVAARIVALDVPLPAGVSSAKLRHNKIAAEQWWAPLHGRVPDEPQPPRKELAPQPPSPGPSAAPLAPSAAPVPSAAPAVPSATPSASVKELPPPLPEWSP